MSCCHKPKCTYDHYVLSQVLPWGYHLPDTRGSEDAEALTLLPTSLSPLHL